MMIRPRNVSLIAWTLMLEAWRRREIYAIVLVTTLLLIALRFVHFFDIDGLAKFYREISLKVMNITAAATVILLAARQLPREFSLRTIYPMLAKPISRLEFLLGKYVGVIAAGCFCYLLFMIIFLIGSYSLGAPVELPLFMQSIYLQALSLCVLAGLVFLLSMLLSPDAAITIAAILYFVSQILMNLMSYLYDMTSAIGKELLLALHFVIPQLTLFDVSAKLVHSSVDGQEYWGPIHSWVLLQLTFYACAYSVLYLSGSFLLFRPEALMTTDCPSAMSLLIRLTCIDFLRRKDFYVVAVFMLLFVVATIVVRIIGIERASTARFLMSAGLSLSHLLAAVVAATFSARCFPEEFDHGTLMPLLAKPVKRGQVVRAKLFSCIALALAAYVLFIFVTLLAVPMAPGQRIGALIQVALLQAISLSFLASLSLALSLYLPTLVAALVSLLWYFSAGFLLNLIEHSIFAHHEGLQPFLTRVLALFPDMTQAFHIELFTDSQQLLPGLLFVSLAFYGAAWFAAFYLLALWKFERVRL